jgi:hypothetical protein
MTPVRYYALNLVILLGAVVGVVVGFIVAVMSPGSRVQPNFFSSWLRYPEAFGWWPWPLFGAAIALIIYLLVWLHSSHRISE